MASVFMPAGMPPVSAGLLIAVVGTAIGFPCVSVWALFGVGIRGFLKDAGKQRAFNLAMAAALLVLAGMFLD
jgi:threonine/homoserine/homoserine lactone efflux protein